MEKAWFIYAAGGGWGHLTRSISLALSACHKYPCVIFTNSPYTDNVLSSQAWKTSKESANIEIVRAESQHSFIDLLKDTLVNKQLSCFITDTFPRGILGELPDVFSGLSKDVKRILVHRDINAEYVHKFAIRNFVLHNYHLLLNPGEQSRPPLADLAMATPAWICKNADSLPERSSIRKTLGISDDAMFALVCISGNKDEVEFYCQIARAIMKEFPQLELRCLSSGQLETDLEALQINYWPGMDFIAAADFVIGSGAYNTVNECKTLGVPLIACPQQRMYDQQLDRCRDDSSVKLALCLEDVLRAVSLMGRREASPRRVDYVNGANQAFQLIDRLLTVGKENSQFAPTGSGA